MNTLYYGDNLKILREYTKDESVDLIYFDPPFNSNRNYNVLFRNESGTEAEAPITAFEDTWHWNIGVEETYNELINEPGRVGRMIESFRSFIGQNQMMADLLVIAIILLPVMLGACSGRPTGLTNSSTASTSNVQSITSEDQARVLVGLDDKRRTAADADDIRVKRVRYLLEELVEKTDEDLVAIGAATDSTSTFIENKYGRDITRQKLLEDMKSFYSNPNLKLKHGYKEAITAHAILEYSK
jgi:hypothetical protein